MHPADEFEAFGKLVEQGRSVEDIASAFSVTPLFVKRRLKLASVSPSLMQMFRKDAISLDCLMVLASVDDHAKQERVWHQTPDWQRRPHELRRLLNHGDIHGLNDPVATFVTVEAYEQAGGPTRRDLFSDEDDVFLLDGALLEKLAVDKLQPAAMEVQAEGWKWVEVCARFDRAHYDQSHGMLRPLERAPSPREQGVLEQLGAQLQAVYEAMDSLEEDGPEGEQLVEQEQALNEKLRELRAGLMDWPKDCLAHAGCVVHVGSDGNVTVRRGLVRPQERAIIQAILEQQQKESATNPVMSLPVPETKPVHSERLIRSLTAHRVAALQAEVIQRPRVALAVLAAHLWQQFEVPGSGALLDLRGTNVHEGLPQAAGDLDLDQGRAWMAVAQNVEGWRQRLPSESGALLPWLLEQDEHVVHELLATVVAVCVPGVSSSEKSSPALQALTKAAALDMTAWWKPTAASYLEHVSKARIEAVVQEAVDSQAARALRDMKKPNMVAAAAKALEKTTWLPELFRLEDAVHVAKAGGEGEVVEVMPG